MFHTRVYVGHLTNTESVLNYCPFFFVCKLDTSWNPGQVSVVIIVVILHIREVISTETTIDTESTVVSLDITIFQLQKKFFSELTQLTAF